MSLVKHIEQIKAFIIQNIYFFGQLFLLATTFVIWKLAEALFSFHTGKVNTSDKEITRNDENTVYESVEEKSEPVEERTAPDEEKSAPDEEGNTRNLQTTTKIQIESEKENEAKQLTDKKNG